MIERASPSAPRNQDVIPVPQANALGTYRGRDHRQPMGEGLANLALHAGPVPQGSDEETNPLVDLIEGWHPTQHGDALSAQRPDLIGWMAPHQVKRDLRNFTPNQ